MAEGSYVGTPIPDCRICFPIETEGAVMLVRHRLFRVLLITSTFVLAFAPTGGTVSPRLSREKARGLLVGYGIQPSSWAGSVAEEVRVTTLYPTVSMASLSQGRWRLDVELEGIFGCRTNRNKGIIVGAGPLIRIMNTRWRRLVPYLEVGAGGSYNDLNLEGMGSRWNFSLEGGIGSELRIRTGLSLRVEYRLLHLSNGGLAKENRALNANLLLVGAWYSF